MDSTAFPFALNIATNKTQTEQKMTDSSKLSGIMFTLHFKTDCTYSYLLNKLIVLFVFPVCYLVIIINGLITLFSLATN